MVTGKSHDFLLDPNTSGAEIAAHVFANWPSGMVVLEHWLPIGQFKQWLFSLSGNILPSNNAFPLPHNESDSDCYTRNVCRNVLWPNISL